jgi:hypothetical protein
MRIPLLASVLASCLASLPAVEARAAPPWVDRPLTLPANDWSFDLGLGLGSDASIPDLGAGLSAEAAFGLTDRIELGAHLGCTSFLRSADPTIPAPEFNYDDYARLFDRLTFDQGPGYVANPELRLRGAALRDAVAEIALDVRLVAPLATHSGLGLAFGVPFAFHLGDRVRIDGAVYETVVLAHLADSFNDSQPSVVPASTAFAVAAPVAIWVQVIPRLWVGPMGGLTVDPTTSPSPGTFEGSAGLGLGYQVGDQLDIKAMFQFDTTHLGNEKPDAILGGGMGFEWRIE